MGNEIVMVRSVLKQRHSILPHRHVTMIVFSSLRIVVCSHYGFFARKPPLDVIKA
jgi:hypothetical protein